MKNQTSYGAWVTDEYGQRVYDPDAVRERKQVKALEFDLVLPAEKAEEWLKRALIPAGKRNALAHITRLALHKHLASGESTKVLLDDYAKSLELVPEVPLAIVCQHLWQDDKGRFMPTIAEIRLMAGRLASEMRERLAMMQTAKAPKLPPPPPLPDKPSPVRRISQEELASRRKAKADEMRDTAAALAAITGGGEWLITKADETINGRHDQELLKLGEALPDKIENLPFSSLNKNGECNG